ncbi:MAG: hypothetical protein U9N79_04410 [Actinomycetota bacterium]|nr:hypothetical protein [Actinomycetota bacterium]
MKGRPILGVITGFLFGLFLGVTLFLYGVIPLSSDMLWILPLLGILLGLIMAAWAPFGRSAEPVPPQATFTAASGGGTADITGDIPVETTDEDEEATAEATDEDDPSADDEIPEEPDEKADEETDEETAEESTTE